MEKCYLALDSEYKNRYELYTLTNNKVYDSRLINWRQIEWEKVIILQLFIRDFKYVINCFNKPTFRFMLKFRTAGIESHKLNNAIETKKINTWTVGWTDGENAHLLEIDFKQGYLIRKYITKLSNVEKHIHPRCLLNQTILI